MLVGLAVVFAIVASVATVSATWIVQANEIGRFAAIALLLLVSLTLVEPRIAELTTRPFVRVGSGLDRRGVRRGGIAGNVAIGAAIGLLWAPCAGPILGLLVAGAALGAARAHSSVLFTVFAAGAATSLALVTLTSGRVLKQARRYAGADRWVRRGLGVAALAGTLVIATGWDSALYAKGGILESAGAENLLIRKLAATPNQANGKSLADFTREEAPAPLYDEGPAPAFAGGGPWINSNPLDLASLRGKVVLVWFWTFGCYNCLNALPYVNALEAKYRDQGLVVIGVHTPEFPHEKVEANVRSQVSSLKIVYPVVMDNRYAIWNSFRNHYWPAAYFVNAKGTIRYHHFGEGSYDVQDRVVAKLLAEARLTR
jgi:cytochrome c biogenesis protein CcdA/thiol-disulfide isomerase/thioredoxin